MQAHCSSIFLFFFLLQHHAFDIVCWSIQCKSIVLFYYLSFQCVADNKARMAKLKTYEESSKRPELHKSNAVLLNSQKSSTCEEHAQFENFDGNMYMYNAYTFAGRNGQKGKRLFTIMEMKNKSMRMTCSKNYNTTSATVWCCTTYRAC